MPTTVYSLGWRLTGKEGGVIIQPFVFVCTPEPKEVTFLYIYLCRRSWVRSTHSLSLSAQSLNSQLHQRVCTKAKYTSINYRPRDGNQRQQPYGLPRWIKKKCSFSIHFRGFFTLSHWKKTKQPQNKNAASPNYLSCFESTLFLGAFKHSLFQ